MDNSASECGQFLMLGVPGPVLDTAYEALVRETRPGGFILFSRNLESPAQTAALTARLMDLCGEHAPLIAVDEEGGRVSRLRALGVRLPGAARLSAAGDPDLVDRHGKTTAGLLRALGINMNLAPVLDLSGGSPERDGTLRGRCWGTTPDLVLPLADNYLHAMQRGRVLGCGKHFPTYRTAACDPHEDLPALEGNLQTMLSHELLPWLNLLPALPAVMTAHIRMPDEVKTLGLPASLSAHVIGDFLRGQLGYDGLVLTDDLDMGAIRRHHSVGAAAAMAVAAGSDLALLCHHPFEAPEVMNRLATVSAAALADSEARLRRVRRKLPAPEAFSPERWEAWCAQARLLDEQTPEPELDLDGPGTAGGPTFAVDRT